MSSRELDELAAPFVFIDLDNLQIADRILRVYVRHMEARVCYILARKHCLMTTRKNLKSLKRIKGRLFSLTGA